MNKKSYLIAAAFTGLGLLSVSPAWAEYCEDQFYKDMTAVNATLGSDLQWQRDMQSEVLKLNAAKDGEQTAITTIASSEVMSPTDKISQIQAHSAVIEEIQSRLDEITKQNAAKNQEINNLKTVVPQNLADKAKDCAQKIAPLNLVVNLAVQGLALFFTDGASVILPEKALYIDMGEIAHGNLMGGKHSAPNEIKDWINGRLGLHL